MVSIYFILFFLLQGQCILINISVNIPELAKRLFFFCSPYTDLKERKITYLHKHIKMTIHLVRNTIMLKYTIETQQTNNQTNIRQKHDTYTHTRQEASSGQREQV